MRKSEPRIPLDEKNKQEVPTMVEAFEDLIGQFESLYDAAAMADHRKLDSSRVPNDFHCGSVPSEFARMTLSKVAIEVVCLVLGLTREDMGHLSLVICFL